MKLRRKSKILAAAIALIGFSTAASITGTVAWFTASNTVVANGMSLMADTEQGVNISNEGLSTWADTIEASHDGTLSGEQAKFIPTTTTNATVWSHANSTARDEAQPDAALTDLSLAEAGEGIWKVNNSGSSIHDKNVYLLNKFYLRSSTPLAIENKTLYCNSVTATRDGAAKDLDMSFRVLVKYGSTIKIYAPFETTPENGAIASSTHNEVLGENVTIPASSVTTASQLVEISVYCYFEGKDSHCKSANITPEFNTLSVECRFGTETIA